MLICYVDEAGCTGLLPSNTSPIQPAFILSALTLPIDAVRPLTTEFLRLKRRFFPGATAAHPRFLDSVRYEVKGSELRKSIAEGNHTEQRHAIGVLDQVLAMLQQCGACIFGRVWIKGIGLPFDGNSVYTSSVQDIFRTFQHQLVGRNDTGIVIADSRNKPKNAVVSHSIFTQKYRTAGDPFSQIVEMPTFGHSDNHAGLQISDLICSAILFPMAMQAFCSGHVTSVHVKSGYSVISARYGNAIKAAQYRYQDETGKWRGGLTVHDAIAQRSGSLLFK